MNHVAKAAAVTVSSLDQALLDSDSATAVLERLFGCPITIERLQSDPRPPDAEQRSRLNLDPGTDWAHRSVQLQAGTRPLSQADLWYVPSRLHPDMAAALLATSTPFGRVVAALKPRRLTLSTRFGAPGDPIALHHHALLTIDIEGETTPIAEVQERYFAASFPG